MATLPQQSVLRVVNGAQLTAALKAADDERKAAQNAADQPIMTNLAGMFELSLT